MTEDNTTELIEKLTGTLVGTVSEVDEILHTPDMGRVCIAKARVGTPGPTLGYDGVHYGIGVAFSRSEAYSSAIMEAIERTCMMLPPGSPIVKASAAELAMRNIACIDPGELCHFTAEQYALDDFPLSKPPESAEDCFWLPATYLASGAEVLVPAEYCVSVPGAGECWWQVTSSGMGAGASREAACLSGLLELVERDAVMTMWHGTSRPAIFGCESWPKRIVRLVEDRVAPAGLTCRFFDLTAVHRVPTCLALVWGKRRGRRIYGVGSATHRSWTATVEKALREALGMHYTATRYSVAGKARSICSRDIRSFSDRVIYYLDQRHQAHLTWITDDADTVCQRGADDVATGPATPSESLEWFLGRLGPLADRLVAIDLSPSGGSALGAHVYRIVSPDLIPLNAAHLTLPLRHPRMPSTCSLDTAPHPLT